VHAGEADGPESVWAAVSFGTPRIGHGIRAISDPELLKVIKKKGIVLEMCPTSNLQTGAAGEEEYPLMKYLQMEIPVTLNTDNMTVSGTTLAKEFEVAEKLFGLTEEGRRVIVETAKRCRFEI
jgi:adenosine deaminase